MVGRTYLPAPREHMGGMDKRAKAIGINSFVRVCKGAEGTDKQSLSMAPLLSTAQIRRAGRPPIAVG